MFRAFLIIGAVLDLLALFLLLDFAMNPELIVGQVESPETKFLLQPDGTTGFGVFDGHSKRSQTFHTLDGAVQAFGILSDRRRNPVRTGLAAAIT